MKRFRIRFYGRVQGVGFRYTALHAAQSLYLTGWVKNERDGTVSCEVQGGGEMIDRFLALLNNGRYIEIDDMDIREAPVDEDERTFYVKH